jgi:hypothetical protein
LSNIYEDGTPISILKHNNNAFLKNKSSNFTSNVYVGGGASSAYNKTKVTMPLPTEPENTTNDISLDVTDMTDVSEIKNTDNSE